MASDVVLLLEKGKEICHFLKKSARNTISFQGKKASLCVISVNRKNSEILIESVNASRDLLD